MLRELHDLLNGKAMNLNIVLYIQRGVMNDCLVREYFENNAIDENFTIVRSRDELYYMMGCLQTNSNKFVYASKFKNSVSQDVSKLINSTNPDPRKDSPKLFEHVTIKDFLKSRDRNSMLRLIQKLMPDTIDLTKETYISQPIKSKQNLCKLL